VADPHVISLAVEDVSVILTVIGDLALMVSDLGPSQSFRPYAGIYAFHFLAEHAQVKLAPLHELSNELSAVPRNGSLEVAQ
jgi:hypothetical protein